MVKTFSFGATAVRRFAGFAARWRMGDFDGR
jgi:hypothetical protein